MIKYILNFFGYIKIPVEVVQLSIEQEVFFERIIEYIPETKEIFELHLKGQKTLTQFLKSGRLL